MQRTSQQFTAEGKKISLVPTMGFLHDGHLSLITRAQKQSDVVITTIFVNPAQFSANEDLGSYPRDERKDIRNIKAAGGHIVFIPKVDEIYESDFQTYVNVEKLTKTLEGEARPEHFRGVTTVVAKLFNICRPDVAIFGMKDFQQAVVLKQMARDLSYPVKMIIAPTVREKDGLAMSSRNKYFNDVQRQEAVCLYRALKTAREMVHAGLTKTAKIRREMRSVILATCPTATIDYIAFTDFKTLKSVSDVKDAKTVCSLAVRVHKVRLIDNMAMT